MARERMTAEQRLAITRRVTVVGAVVNVLLAISKLLFGWIAQSQALIADGIHSLSDLLSDALVLVAAGHAHQAPDKDHPYGHGRFETLATLGLGVLLALVAIGIGWDAANRLFHPEALLVPGKLALLVALFSILANEGLYHYTRRAARRTGSDMLRANAWHHRSDAASSVVVLVGVGGTIAGLPYLDAIAAIGVALMIAHISWELVWPAAQELADAALDQERVVQIRDIIESVTGVEEIHMLRTRRMGGLASVDVHVLVDPRVSVSEGHQISQTVMDRLLDEVDEVADVTVHIDPEDDEEAAPSKGLPLRDRAEATLARCWQGVEQLPADHRLVLHYLDGMIDVDLILPLSAYREERETQALKGRLQRRIADNEQFRQVRLFYTQKVDAQ